ncbi:hypothetical protein IQ279_12680 [Streptomyces verrucosisporus]|uniref:DUF6542 domain-containing protein n=1 Tax=Streptomyces verrucosisporus TaxID=1695161 RepID=UPI0019D2A2F5|nr:DUF6542 domain-containing protein [Streptomyces verrucosisporus]MBN3930480.1 hypothetical protein [Streptomyces verrucosisporus]
MEQHSARIPRLRPRRRTAQPSSPEAAKSTRRDAPERPDPDPPRADTRTARTGPPARREWPPGARLTGLGCGLLATGAMLLAGGLDALLLGGDPAVYGISFVLVSAVCALWVRPADLAAAPIAVPIAFTAGLVFVSGGSGGPADRLVELVTALAVHTGWLYGGTLTAVAVAVARGPGARRAGPGGARRAGARSGKAGTRGRGRAPAPAAPAGAEEGGERPARQPAG